MLLVGCSKYLEYPPSPSKRRRETAYRQGLSLNLKYTSIPRGPLFADPDANTESIKENTHPGSRSRATTPTTPTTATIDSSIGYKHNRSLLQTSTPTTTTQTVTPPMTPTRRSTRQSRSPPSDKNNNYACENSTPPHPNSQQQSIPTTPKRKSPVLRERSPSCSDTNHNNSTGLTPAMNRMLKPSKGKVSIPDMHDLPFFLIVRQTMQHFVVHSLGCSCV